MCTHMWSRGYALPRPRSVKQHMLTATLWYNFAHSCSGALKQQSWALGSLTCPMTRGAKNWVLVRTQSHKPSLAPGIRWRSQSTHSLVIRQSPALWGRGPIALRLLHVPDIFSGLSAKKISRIIFRKRCEKLLKCLKIVVF